jgi:protein JBTS26
MLKFVLLTSQGDPYYIGLNGFEIFDHHGRLIELSEDQLQAAPYRLVHRELPLPSHPHRDVNDLPEIRERGSDARRLQNLIHPENNTFNDLYMWLSPLPSTSAHTNTIFVMFDEPMRISHIKFWNYSKTPTRGVKEIEVCFIDPAVSFMLSQIFLDDVLVYKGNLRPSPTKEMYVSADLSVAGEDDVWWVRLDDHTSLKGESQKEMELDLSQTILFTNDLTIIATEVAISSLLS